MWWIDIADLAKSDQQPFVSSLCGLYLPSPTHPSPKTHTHTRLQKLNFTVSFDLFIFQLRELYMLNFIVPQLFHAGKSYLSGEPVLYILLLLLFFPFFPFSLFFFFSLFLSTSFYRVCLARAGSMLSLHSLLCSFAKLSLISTYYVPVTGLSSGDTEIKAMLSIFRLFLVQQRRSLMLRNQIACTWFVEYNWIFNAEIYNFRNW